MEIMEKINSTKSWLFKNINRTDKLLARLIKKRTMKTQYNKIWYKKDEVTTDNTEIESFIREYYEQLYGNKIDKMEEIETFL